MVSVCQVLRSLRMFRRSPRPLPEPKEKFKAYDDTSSQTTSVNTEKNGYYRDAQVPRVPISVRAQHHYGITIADKFDEKIHSEEDRFWDSLEERWRVYRQIVWLVKKGTTVYLGSPFRRRALYRTWNKDGPRRIRIQIHTFAGEGSPPESIGAACPESIASQVNRVVHVTIDVGDLLVSPTLVPYTNSVGEEYFKFHFMLEMSMMENGTSRIEFIHENEVFWSTELM